MRFDRQVVESLAQEVKDAYVQGINPNTKIKELADTYNLAPLQIKRVCEASNVSIKRYLDGKSADRSYTFPLADASEVISAMGGGKMEDIEVINKQASYDDGEDWQWFEDELGGLGIEKEASDDWVSTDGVATILYGLDQAISKVRCDMNEKTHELSKSAGALERLIKHAFHEDGNLNKIYSIAHALHPESRDTIDNLFKVAHGKMEFIIDFPVENLEITKVGGVINKSSKFAENLGNYILLHEDIAKLASALVGLEDKKQQVAEMFSRMYRDI